MRKINFIRHAQNVVNAKKRNILRCAQNWAVRPRRPHSPLNVPGLVAIDYGYDLYANPRNNHPAARRTTKRHLSKPAILATSVVPSKVQFMPENEPLRTELIPVMKQHEPKKKHLNPLGLPPIVRLASHSVRNWGLDRQERSIGRVHKKKPKRRILNPLHLPPVARAAGINVVMGILARRERMRGMHRGVTVVADDHRDEQTLGDDHLQLLDHNLPTPRILPVKDMDTIEKPPKKTRIYPQRQLRDLCSASDIVNLNMSVLSSPTVQATPKSNIPEAMASRQMYPHLSQPLSTQAQRDHMAIAEVHSSSDNIDAPRPGPSTSSGEQEQPTSFAQMQKMLGDLLSPKKQQTGQLYWELPATTGNDEPLLIPRPDYNAADPPAGNLYPQLASYLPQLPMHQQQRFAHPFNNYTYPQYQPQPTVSMVPSIAHPGSMLSTVRYAPPVLTHPMSRAAQRVSAHMIPGTSYIHYPEEFTRPGRPIHSAAYRGRSHMPRYSSEGLTRTYYY